MEDFISCPRSPVMVISYEMLLRSVDTLKKLEFGLVICDEGHRLKNSNIKTASALTALTCERRVILTGQLRTPSNSRFLTRFSAFFLFYVVFVVNENHHLLLFMLVLNLMSDNKKKLNISPGGTFASN